MGKVYKLDRYRSEANLDPYDLEVTEGDVISIPPPNVETLIAIGETPVTDGRRMLQLLCGDQYDRIWAALSQEPGSVLVAIVKDMVRHFGVGPEVINTPGGLRALPR